MPVQLKTNIMNSFQCIDLENKYGAHNYKPLDVVLSRGEGVWVWDVHGNRYLDCLSAYSAVNQGHCHPKILQARMDQAQKLMMTSRAFRNEQLGLFYQEICEKHNIVLILDEIQTGLGRTGKLLAEGHEDIVADLTLIGKALPGGFYPVSAVLSR